ncbi:MAG: hypothetical protein QOE71_3904 [Pseudonocardiales bacterium]|nr:hypothetical protein [Pseudonocardiales bacterium]
MRRDEGYARRRPISYLCAMLIGLFVSIAYPQDANADARCLSTALGVRCENTSGAVGALAPGVVSGSEYVTDVLSCGPRRKHFDDAQVIGNLGCLNYLLWCPLAPGAAVDPTKQIVAYQVYNAGTKAYVRTDIACDTPTGSALPNIAAIRAEAIRHAPQPTAASGGTRYLINSAVVFYLRPAQGASILADTTIPRFTLGGHTFDVRLHLTESTWTWGDGRTDSYSESQGADPLGRAYDDAVACESRTVCSRYIAHPFESPGRFTITVQAHWTGTFALDGGTRQIPIPGDIYRSDPLGRTITVYEARSVLVAPDPS